MRFKGLWMVTFMMGLYACIEPPKYPVEPEINFLSFSKSTVDQLDTFLIRIEFKDGDGDIGFQTLDTSDCDLCDTVSPASCFNHPTLSLFVIDNRSGCMTNYNIPYIPPKGSSSSISGKILIRSFVCCRPPDGLNCIPNNNHPLDSVTFNIRIRDVAGHFSNTIVTPKLYINCN